MSPTLTWGQLYASQDSYIIHSVRTALVKFHIVDTFGPLHAPGVFVTSELLRFFGIDPDKDRVKNVLKEFDKHRRPEKSVTITFAEWLQLQTPTRVDEKSDKVEAGSSTAIIESWET